VRRVLPPSTEDGEARQLTALRKRIAQTRTRTINRIHHILQKHNMQQECPTKGKKTKKARQWMSTMTLPSVDRLEMDQLLAQWDMWDEQLETVEEKIDASQAEHATAKIVASMPGAGTYSSLALASRIGPIDRFPRPASLANYWGIAPGCHNSGQATNRSGSITKEGSAIARHILGQMVLHVLRDDKYVKKWYMQIKKRRGSKIARVAVMRQLTTRLWHMLKHQHPYIPGGPEVVAKTRSVTALVGG
jgi:transposase